MPGFMIMLSIIPEILFWILALIVFILVLGVIILVHEGGHFFFAKRAGILCHEFSIGMGPIIKTIKKGETSYSIRAIPIGGFVSMAGEDTNETLLKEGQMVSLGFKEVNYKDLLFNKDVEDNNVVKVVSEISLTEQILKEVTGKVVSYDLYSENGDAMYIELEVDGNVEKYLVARDAFYIFSEKQQIQLAPYERCYESKTKLQRFLTCFAGPFMNFVLALLIFLMIGLGSGVANTDSTEIGELTEGYPAALHLEEGDIIKEVNGVKVNSWTEFSQYLNNNVGSETFDITVERNGQTITKTVPTVNISYRLGIANFNSIDYIGPGLKVSMVYDDHYVVGKAGLVEGDVILGYYVGEDYFELENWKQIFDYLDANPELETLKIKYQHEETIKEVETDVWTEKSISQIGANASSATKLGVACSTKFSLFGGIANGFILFWNSITAVFVTLGALFGNSQITINELSGPVGIFAVIKQYLSTDFFTFMSFVGMISANIGLVNLLPLPALDGGRIVFIGYELVTRKKVNKNVETALINIVFWLVMLLFIYITFKDIIRLF